MQLGNGLGLQRFNVINSFTGVLDELGNYNNCVLGVSYKRLSKNFKDELIEIKRVSDSSVRQFGYDKNGDLETSEISTWLGASNGYVNWINNQPKTSKKLEQTNDTYKPLYNINGLNFDGTDDRLETTNYSEVDILNPYLSIYTNYTNKAINIGYIIAKNLDSSANVQFSMINFSGSQNSYLEGASRISASNNSTSNNKELLEWGGKGTNELKLQTSVTANTATLNTTLTSRNLIALGARGTYSTFLNAYLKTCLVFNSKEYSNRTNFINAGL